MHLQVVLLISFVHHCGGAEAVPLRTISAKSVAQALFQVISRVGIPKEILTDQGTQFMSRTLGELYGLLGIKSIRTSV